MPNLGWSIILGICVVIGTWQFALWQVEVRSKNEKYRNARTYARRRNKPLLIAGGPYGHRRIRRLLKMPAHGGGDVCLDIDRNAVECHPNPVLASVTDIPFADKAFGAAFASHLLEHLPTVDAATQALAELNRIADAVFIVSPSRQSISGWLHPDHHLWVWQNGLTTFMKQRGRSDNGRPRQRSVPVKAGGNLVLADEAELLASQLFGSDVTKRAEFTRRVLDICSRAEGKDFLLIHNPGGWGGTPLQDLMEWERSVVYGVAGAVEQAGYSLLLIQHFRGGSSWRAHLKSAGEQAHFVLSGRSSLVSEMVAELGFLSRRFPALKIVMLGVSQGAAFGNAVMRQINDLPQVYSIELGLIFLHIRRRVITERTLALDSNGMVTDPVVHLNLWVTLKAYVTAPYRWLKYRLGGHPRKLSYCINAPGHDYDWKYQGVRGRIEDFLRRNFGAKDKLEVDL